MAIFKCKICGGSLEIDNAQSVATCEYCGTKQTLPKLDDERRANLYDRANHFRRNNDFDKAMGIYENILNEDNTDAEAYWSLVLCRYGIEYVEDPATRKRVPTVNRAQFTSIFDDEDYKSAIANADGYQREIYEAEATAINEIQKGILAISQKEEPFDIFVCYKETDTSGRRTQDSVLATELYHELTREGFKVFFSRITLEDKLGVAYEPYIFAALHSAKVMVVLGTRPEHFNAVWVKNEWSRYLALIKNGAKKTLIPAYRDMDPYDLPEEFSHLQAQDMSKLGFMQDLTRGIKKIVEVDAPKATVKETIVATAASLNIAPLLKRAFMFLEDGDFDRADEFCEQVLNQDPENAQAYLGKLMAELRVKRQADLINCAEPFDSNKNYEKAVRFADAKLASELRGYIATIKDRNARKAEEARKEALYLKAMDDYKSYDIVRLQEAIKVFTSLAGYKDSDERIRLCQVKIDQIRIKEENDRIERERLAEEKRIADEKALLERQRQAEIDRVEAKKRAKRNKKIAMIVSPIVVAVITFVIVLNSVIIPSGKYNDAIALMNDAKYEEAISAFEALDGYKDSLTQIENCKVAILDEKLEKALKLLTEKKYDEAYAILSSLGSHGDASTEISKSKYERAIELYNQTEYDSAILLFTQIIGYEDSKEYISKCNYAKNDIVYNEAMSKYQSKKYEEAKEMFASISGHRDASQYVTNCNNIISQRIYETAENYLLNNDWYKAATTFYSIKDYSDAKERSLSIWRDNLPSTTITTNNSGLSTHTYAVKNNGSVLATGELNAIGYSDLSGIKSWSNISSISANGNFVVGLKKDGTVVATGSNSTNQLSVSSWRNIIQISAGGHGTFGVKSDGTVVSTEYIASSSDWRQFNYGQNNISEWSDIVYISASSFHTVGLKADGTVVAVGQNTIGQCDVSEWKDIVYIETDTVATYGVKADGTVVYTKSGDNVSSWRNIKTISVSDYHIVGLKKDGTVVASGSSVADNGELNVNNWNNIVSAVAGEKCTIALDKNGQVYVIGLVGHVDGRGQANGWTNIKLP